MKWFDHFKVYKLNLICIGTYLANKQQHIVLMYYKD